MRLVLAATIAILAIPANAQEAPNAAAMADARTKLMAADTNQDGKWDKAEWLAAGRREMGFTFIDADKDSFVTQDELKAGMERMRARRGN